MSCSCAYETETCDETATLWVETNVRKTRKEHRCFECGDLIPIGSRCCKASCLFDGSWDVMYRCVSCAIYAEYISMAAKMCPLWGHLRDFVSDNDLNWDRHDGLELPSLADWRARDAEHRPVAG